MNKIDASNLLSQIRTLGKDLQPLEAPTESPGAPFSELLKTSVNAVNEAQHEAASLKAGFVTGTSEKSLAEVMIAAQKADLSFRAVTEVRNKLITAYQDIMNMPV